jgi:phospholipid-binding lipoprotein MlaA
MQKKSIGILALFFAVFSSAFADSLPQPNPNDPYETYNRHAYKMNKKLDQIVFKPVASLYKDITPSPLRKGVNNFLSNLSQIPTVINDVLQLNLLQAGRDVVRFGVNTTIGLVGFLDIASSMGFDRNPQDFGLTLAKWGYQSSNYLVLPILGPSTVRDAISWPIYYEMTIYPYLNDTTLTYSLLGLDFIDIRTQFLDLDPVIEQSFDPYVFERNAYLQRRNFLMQKNSGTQQNLAPLNDKSESSKNNNGTHSDEHAKQVD